MGKLFEFFFSIFPLINFFFFKKIKIKPIKVEEVTFMCSQVSTFLFLFFIYKMIFTLIKKKLFLWIGIKAAPSLDILFLIAINHRILFI